jgi:hypothetical protein
MRNKYETRKLYLANNMVRDTAIQLLQNAPIDPLQPLEVIIREKAKTRGNDANALMWAGALKDIAEQVWVDGRQFNAEVWHEHFKREHLPEDATEGITREGYRKWDVTPSGERVLVGSTTQLTTKGFSEYLERIHADGASMGVLFRSVRSE